MALWRPALRGRSPEAMRTALLFGSPLAAMNFSFYEGLERVPLGIAVTLEFVGPLGVAIVGSRRARDLLWVALAGGGILLLSPGLGGELDPLGAGLCLLAGRLLGHLHRPRRAGRPRSSRAATAWPWRWSSRPVLLVPVGLAEGGADLLEPELLAAGLAARVCSARRFPYSLELEALRHLREGHVRRADEPRAAASPHWSGSSPSTRTSPRPSSSRSAMVVAASAGRAASTAAHPPCATR